MTKIDLSQPLPLPDSMQALASVLAADHPITIGEGHLERQYQELAAEVQQAVAAVLPSGKYTLGPNLKRFEQEYAAYCETRHSIGVSSGTAALHLALEAMGVGPGDEVITVANTYIATALGASYTGATPVFVDVDPKTFNMTAELAAERITKRTRVLLPVHLYGHVADMDPIMALAEEHGLMVLEDASHAHGARYKGRRAGSLGHMAAFSFYPGKNIGAYGDGGAITTNDADLDAKVRILRYIGQRVKFIHEVIGFQDRLDEIQAAILSVKLKRLDEWNSRRRALAAIYDEMLGQTPLQLPHVAEYAYHVYYSYATIAPSEDERNKLLAYLLKRGIGAFAMYPAMVPMQAAYLHLGYRESDFPVASGYARRVLNLPMFETLRPDEARATAEAILAYYDRA